jgi:hypothetical protein
MPAARTAVSVILLISLLFVTITSPSKADTFRPVVRGKRGVVAGGSPLSVEAACAFSSAAVMQLMLVSLRFSPRQ